MACNCNPIPIPLPLPTPPPKVPEREAEGAVRAPPDGQGPRNQPSVAHARAMRGIRSVPLGLARPRMQGKGLDKGGKAQQKGSTLGTSNPNPNPNPNPQTL